MILRCLVLLLILKSSLFAGDDKSISLATCEWPPYVGKSLPYKGVTAAITTAVFDEKGYDVKLNFMPWSRVMISVDKDQYDIAFPAYFSEERTKIYRYSDPIMNTPLYLCKLKSSNIVYDGLESLKPYRIGTVNGYINSPEFDAADYLNKKPANDDTINLLKLLGKRVDLVVVDKYTALHLEQTTMPQLKDKLEFLEPPLDQKLVYLLMSKKSPRSEKVLSDFNEGLKEVKKTGKFDEILKIFNFHHP